MWTIDATDFALLRGGGGQPFTAFVDALIRAHAFVNGVGDGGGDTQVSSAMPVDSTGYFPVPSCWQYKAVDASKTSGVDLRKEINKHYAQELLKQGYGYRLAICDEVTPVKKTNGKFF